MTFRFFCSNVKSKISVALCAQNRKKLLGKLEQLGITEEEYLAKKRKQKSQYERDRRKSKKERENRSMRTHQKKYQELIPILESEIKGAQLK